MIPREIYLKKLRLLKDQDLIKVITGVRRSGKSTLLESFRNEILSSGVNNENIFYLNFEDRETLQFKNWVDVYDEISKKLIQIKHTMYFWMKFNSLIILRNLSIVYSSKKI